MFFARARAARGTFTAVLRARVARRRACCRARSLPLRAPALLPACLPRRRGPVTPFRGSLLLIFCCLGSFWFYYAPPPRTPLPHRFTTCQRYFALLPYYLLCLPQHRLRTCCHAHCHNSTRAPCRWVLRTVRAGSFRFIRIVRYSRAFCACGYVTVLRRTAPPMVYHHQPRCRTRVHLRLRHALHAPARDYAACLCARTALPPP